MRLYLPASIFLAILNDYVSDANDLRSLDVAMSDTNMRCYYLSIYDNISMPCFESKEFVHTLSSLLWTMARNIKLSDIVITSLSHKTLHVIDELLSQSPTSLHTITFDKCNFFNERCSLNERCNHVETMIIRNSMISNNALKGLTKSMHKLRIITLDFENCEEHDQNISDTALYVLANNCKQLRRINTRYALHISEGCLQRIRNSNSIEIYSGF